MNDEIWVYCFLHPEEMGLIIETQTDPENGYEVNVMVQWPTHASWHAPDELRKAPDA